ncbi:Adenylate cyclase 2 [Frondihabitans sp. 762G35]|uniref:adenylate/guanylate cyclase domain-containing protein n=1 Tax=Frondihabitans sp. 762G35 TaxID=1446794 RepID=UPI000D21C7BE|nr:adenylate/guanylate cyclase domain-containing protein [Frondihabitans sp. 762G35]ARC58392.1 Adenylate cyclase 2 [Frondihabitans sp. 762G35]
MTLKDDVEREIKSTVETALSTSKQQLSNDKVPKSSEIGYSGGVYLQSVYLYADMIDSSGLVRHHPPETVARVFKAYLQVAVRVIRAHDGYIRSFDGDRVMGVFAGPDRAIRAVKAAMKIKWSVEALVQPALRSQFKSLQDSGWKLQGAIGIANGEALLIRAGIRDNDDLVSIGRNANFAAKLSDERHGNYTIRIGAGAHALLNDDTRLSSGVNMWEGPYSMKLGGEDKNYYRTSYRWKL